MMAESAIRGAVDVDKLPDATESAFGCCRFLFTIPWDLRHIGGVNQVVTNLALNVMKGGGHRPIVLNFQHGFNRLTREELPNGLTTLRFTLRNPRSKAKPLRAVLSFLMHLPNAILKVHKLVQKEKITTINVHYPTLAAIPIAMAAKFLPKKRQFVLSFHGADLRNVSEARGIWLIVWRMLCLQADSIIFCSSALAHEFQDLLPDVGQKVSVVHNGIDYDQIQALALKGSLPKELIGTRFILNAATLEHKKGQDVLIRAFARVAGKFPDVRLVLMGRTSDAKDGLASLVEKLGMQDRVLILENVRHEDVLASMKVAELFVLSSRKEPFGIVLLEAAAFHTPIIASRTGGIVEIIDHEVTGLLVEPDNVEDLAQCITKFLDGTVRTDSLTSSLHSRVVSEFTWKRATAEYIRIASQLTS